MKVISVDLKEPILEQIREVKVDDIVVFLRIVCNPNTGKVGWLERLREVMEHEGGNRQRSVFRSPPKPERSRDLRFGNLWKRR